MYIYHPLTTLTCPFVFITHTHFQVIIFPASTSPKLTHNTRVYTGRGECVLCGDECDSVSGIVQHIEVLELNFC